MAKTKKKKLPRLALIADRFTKGDVAERALAAAEAGMPWVHLRDHRSGDEAFAKAARALAERLRGLSKEVLVSVNGRLGVARALGAGLHTGRQGPSLTAARRQLGTEAPLGFSAHRLEEAEQAADYFFFSPVFPTTSKPGHPGTGTGALEAFCAASEAPVLALGGLTPERTDRCLEAGAHGIAVLSGILHADDPAAAARKYLSLIQSMIPN